VISESHVSCLQKGVCVNNSKSMPVWKLY
jgi:hypothetical protein